VIEHMGRVYTDLEFLHFRLERVAGLDADQRQELIRLVMEAEAALSRALDMLTPAPDVRRCFD
jgi:hypothetical protein